MSAPDMQYALDTARQDAADPSPRVYSVMFNGFKIGCVARREYWDGAGWQYVPGNCRQKASRKLWPSPEAAIKGRVPKDATLEPVQ